MADLKAGLMDLLLVGSMVYLKAAQMDDEMVVQTVVEMDNSMAGPMAGLMALTTAA